jgi:hypothetical protein
VFPSASLPDTSQIRQPLQPHEPEPENKLSFLLLLLGAALFPAQ